MPIYLLSLVKFINHLTPSIIVKDKTYLQQLLGTNTKIRTFQVLSIQTEGISRHALSKEVGTGIGPLYEQVDQLIALGAIMEENDRILMNEEFPLHDTLMDLVLNTADLLEDQGSILEILDRINGDEYYLTGYTGACQNGPPIDYDIPSIMIAVLNPDTRKKRKIRSVSECSDVGISWFKTEGIPDDVRRDTAFGTEAWLASLERSLVDCYKMEECEPYPIVLLLIQNMVDGSLDVEKLMKIAREEGCSDLFENVMIELSNKKLKIPEGLLGRKKTDPDPSIKRVVKNAWNTVMGG